MTTFLSLPPEIRISIIDLVFENTTILVHTRQPGVHCPLRTGRISPLLLTCRQLHHEGQARLYSSTFCYRCHCARFDFGVDSQADSDVLRNVRALRVGARAFVRLQEAFEEHGGADGICRTLPSLRWLRIYTQTWEGPSGAMTVDLPGYLFTTDWPFRFEIIIRASQIEFTGDQHQWTHALVSCRDRTVTFWHYDHENEPDGKAIARFLGIPNPTKFKAIFGEAPHDIKKILPDRSRRKLTE